MRRDYAKRNLYRKKSKKSFTYVWLTLLLLFGSSVVALIKFDNCRYLYQKLTLIKLGQKLNKFRQQIPKTAIAVTQKDTSPKLDFYNILPQTKGIKSDIAYELEIATVNDFTSADHLKAELALLGFAASITPIYQQGIQKHYISIGPYDNKDNAIQDQQKLKLNRIKSTLKKVR